jgi:hypothetical protein
LRNFIVTPEQIIVLRATTPLWPARGKLSVFGSIQGSRQGTEQSRK